jgi:hypothetical protein
MEGVTDGVVMTAGTVETVLDPGMRWPDQGRSCGVAVKAGGCEQYAVRGWVRAVRTSASAH